jgi:hypothetical protein
MEDDYNLRIGDSAILHPHHKHPKRVTIIGFAHGGRSAIVHGISGSPEECQIELTTQLVPLDWKQTSPFVNPWYPQDKLIPLTYAC